MPDNRNQKIKVTKNGPYVVTGNVPLRKESSTPCEDEIPCKWRKGKKYSTSESYLLCRCGKSLKKPFCDNAHLEIDFKGKETAENKTYKEMAIKYEGPRIDLHDAEDLCSIARFCERAESIWNEVLVNSKKAREDVIEEAGNCPSGRLVAVDKESGKAIEPKFPPSISVTQDPAAGASGPLWVKGGIEIESAKGTKYEKRNRVTLCRCGKSANKPFCDGTHLQTDFDDKI